MPKRKKIAKEYSLDGINNKRPKKENWIELCKEVIRALKQYTSENGRSLLNIINEVYKNKVNKVNFDNSNKESLHLNFDQIINKVKAEQYLDLDQLTEDIESIINDIKSVFHPDSQEYNDANELYEFFLDVKQDICSFQYYEDSNSLAGNDVETLSNTESDNNYEHEICLDDLIATVNEATDDDGRNISIMFQMLPPKSRYPDYYQIINDPIDLKTIENKNKNNEYKNLNELEKDLLLMIRNAKTYNEPGSQIYKDAHALKKIITAKKTDLEPKRYTPLKSSDRIKAKKTPNFKNSNYEKSEKVFEDSPNASLNQDDSLVEDGNDSGLEDGDDPMYRIYEFVRSYKNNQGVRLSDPFMRLPNRRFYPDYYEEIKKPTTLGKIKSKIRSSQYKNVNEMLDELQIMFKNALKYNRSDSKIYKDALELQKNVLQKAKEYTNYVPVDEDSIDFEPEESQNLSLKLSPNKTKKLMSSSLTHELKKARKPHTDCDLNMKKRFKQLYKSIFDYCDGNGRYPIALFMEKPSIKDYPDYYQVIENPIDMKTIDSNIKADRYLSEDKLLSDFKLMFDNCKKYNEDGSQIYLDANTLENVLLKKLNELDFCQSQKSKKCKNKLTSSTNDKIKSLFESIINYKDIKGRQLSKVFMKLPSRVDYSEYYEIIKRPIDLDKIGMKIKTSAYDSLEDLLSDLVLTFDNACKFNEPDSQIYKDSLTLQHYALQTKLELVETGTDGIPDVKLLIQDLLTNLFTSVYGFIDEEGRCYSDSLFEATEHNSVNEVNFQIITFEEIKKNLQNNRYRRLDRFQNDMFAIFEKVRKICRTDSQAFEDSIEMQQYFIRLRNELCKNGERLQSPALNYTEADLNASVENLKQQKLPFEQQQDLEQKYEDRVEHFNTNETDLEINETCLNDIVYRIGDFVYVEPREKNLEPHIINIQKFFKDKDGEINIYGCWFYRPNETFHSASKKFLEKEVFRSDNFNSMPLSQVIRKCCVMFVKDYFKSKPKLFDEKDVYVCESKYFTKIKSFNKIKIWNQHQNFELVPREKEIIMTRIPSVFKVKSEKNEEIESENDPSEKMIETSILDVERVNVRCDPPEGVIVEDGLVYYEQYIAENMSIKLDDFVYIRIDKTKNSIYKIDRIYVNKNNIAFIYAQSFLRQNEIPNTLNQTFYPQEVFQTNQESTFELDKIISKCSVLSFKDYITKRPTEIAESDVYLCESKYCNSIKTLFKLTGGLQIRLLRNPNIVNNEHYVFRKPLLLKKKETEIVKTHLINLTKKNTQLTFDLIPSSPMSTSTILPSSETENEESNDVILPNFGNDSQISSIATSVNKKKTNRRIITGYIVFASEVRKQVCQANPDCNFGDISRIIGSEWKRLPLDTKQEYERRAQKQNETNKEAARLLAESEIFPGSPNSNENSVYECNWDKCDFQCEDFQDLLDHLTLDPSGHVWKQYGHLKDKEGSVFPCLIKGCVRVKKGGAPFPSLQRLIRHCRDVHVNKHNPKFILPENRSKNFTPRKNFNANLQFASKSSNSNNLIIQQPNQNLANSSPQQMLPSLGFNESYINSVPHAINGPFSPICSNQTTSNHVQTKQPTEHLFVLPSRPNRLLYTNTYIKYIERLKPECKHITNWETQLNATPENILHYDKSKLPSHWLANGEGNHGTVINALWALRNFMFQDALNLSKI